MVLHVSGRQAGASQQCRITRQQYGSKLEAAGIQATLYVMMCTVKTHHLFFGLTPPLLHRLSPFVWIIYFSFLGCLITCLPQLVCMHGLPASDPAPLWKPAISCFFFFWSCYMTNIHFYLQTSMTLLIPSSDPPLVTCLCLFIQSHPSGFSFGSSSLWQGRSSVRH